MSSQEEGGASHTFNQGIIGLIVMKDYWGYGLRNIRLEGRDPKHKMV